jgi:hypothetical protein
MTSRRSVRTHVLLFAFFLSGLGVHHARGNTVTIYDSKMNDWTATSVATLAATPANGMNQTTGLMINYKFTKLSAITILFTENDVATMSYGGANKNSGAASGLNFVLTEVFLNMSPKAFSGFTETLTDADILNGKVLDAAGEQKLYGDNGTGAHPAYSHFHPGSASTPFKAPTGFDGGVAQSITFAGGTGLPNDNKTMTDMNVRIHDIVVQGYQRDFILTITPIVAGAPEPASLAMMFTGMVAVLGYGLARRKPASRAPGLSQDVIARSSSSAKRD